MLLAVVVGVGGISVAEAQTSTAWAAKMFEQSTHDFGTVARGADVMHRFKVTNLYQQTVHISKVRTTCGCSGAKETKSTLRSGEVGYIEVTLDTRKFKRNKESILIVTFDAPQFGEVRIPLKAYIRTDVVLTPGAANFGVVDRGRAATKTIEVAYAGRGDWKLKDVKCGSKYLDAEIKEISRVGGRIDYRLTMKLDDRAPAGTFSQQVLLVTNDKTPYVPMMVTARVEEDITVATPNLSLDTVAVGGTKTFNVVIRGRKPFSISKIECDSGDGSFKMRMPEGTRAVHIVPLSYTASEKLGKFDEEFTVTIEGRKKPVTFHVTGRVASRS